MGENKNYFAGQAGWRSKCESIRALTQSRAVIQSSCLQRRWLVGIVHFRKRASFCGDGKVHNNLSFHFDWLTVLVVRLIAPFSDCF